jgi:hypothetical protein
VEQDGTGFWAIAWKQLAASGSFGRIPKLGIRLKADIASLSGLSMIFAEN